MYLGFTKSMHARMPGAGQHEFFIIAGQTYDLLLQNQRNVRVLTFENELVRMGVFIF